MMWLYCCLVFHPGLLGFVPKLGLCRRHALLPKFQCVLNSLEYTAAQLSAPPIQDLVLLTAGQMLRIRLKCVLKRLSTIGQGMSPKFAKEFLQLACWRCEL